MKLIVLIGIFTVLFATATLTLHKLNNQPIVFEIICGAVTLILFLVFEILLHNMK